MNHRARANIDIVHHQCDAMEFYARRRHVHYIYNIINANCFYFIFFCSTIAHWTSESSNYCGTKNFLSHTHDVAHLFSYCQSKSFWWLRKDLDDFYSICTRSNCTIWCKRGICVLNCFNCSHVEWFQLQFMVWHFPLDQSSSAKLAEWNSWWATCEELRSTGGLRVCAIESNVNNPKTKKNKNKKINQKKWKRNERNANK